MKPGRSGARSAGSEFFSECLVCLGPTTARNRLFGGGHLQVISQRLPLGEADDAGDLAACSPAHRTLQLCQAALLPFACCCRDGSGEGRERRETHPSPSQRPRPQLQMWTGQVTSPGLQSGQDLLCTACVWQAPCPSRLWHPHLIPHRLLPCSQASLRPRVEQLSLMPRLSESEVCFSWDNLWRRTQTAPHQKSPCWFSLPQTPAQED